MKIDELLNALAAHVWVSAVADVDLSARSPTWTRSSETCSTMTARLKSSCPLFDSWWTLWHKPDMYELWTSIPFSIVPWSQSPCQLTVARSSFASLMPLQAQRGRLARRRIAVWGAGVLGGVLVLGGTAAAVADPFGVRLPPPPKATHTTVVLDRTFTVNGEDHTCKLTEIVDIKAGPKTDAATKAAVDYLRSPSAAALQPDSLNLSLLLQAEGRLGPVDATDYADAWGSAVSQGLMDHLSSAGLATGSSIESGAVCK